MPPKTAAKKSSIAHARAVRLSRLALDTPASKTTSPGITVANGSSSLTHANEDTYDRGTRDLSDTDCTSWRGGVNHILSSDEDRDGSSESESSSSDGEVDELEGDELRASLEARYTSTDIKNLGLYGPLTQSTTRREWKKAEANRSLGYNGHAARTKRHHAKLARDREVKDAKMRQRCVIFLLVQHPRTR